MSINLKTLITEYAKTEMEQIAGMSGLNTEASWVCYLETAAMAEHMNGGELALVTGIGIPAGEILEESLYAQVRRLKENGACGVIVVIGSRIPAIPVTVRNYCDKVSLPLFAITEELDEESLLRRMCEAIVRDNEREFQISTAFKNAILFPNQPEQYVVPLSQYRFRPEDRYAVCLLRMNTICSEPYATAEEIRARLWNHLKGTYSKCAVFTNGTDIIAVICTEHSDEVRVLAEELLDYTHFLLPSDLHTIYIGIGKLTKSIRCIYKSYRQAESIVKLQMKDAVPRTSIFYTDMGVYRLLMGIEDEEIKQEYFEKVLEPLLIHDREKDSDLVKVLRIYLQNNGSIAATAKELFVHRNTVTYKINQASKILKMDLGSLENRVQIWLAFLLHDMT